MIRPLGVFLVLALTVAVAEGQQRGRDRQVAGAGGQFEVLLQQGNRDEAVGVAAEQFWRWGELLITRGDAAVPDWQVDSLTEAAREAGLDEEILAKTRPPEDADSRPWAVHAAVCEMFHDWPEARAIYEDIVQESDAPLLRVRLAQMVALEDPQAAAQHLLEVDDASRIGPYVFNHPFATNAQLLAQVEMLIHWLEVRDQSDPGARWVLAIAAGGALQGQLHPNLHPALFDPDADMDRVDHELQDRRRQLYRDLSEAMMNDPWLAAEGFAHRLALAEFEGEPLEPYIDRALEIVAMSREPFPPVDHQLRLRGSVDQLFLGPGEFLVTQAWRRDDPLLLDDLYAALEVRHDLEVEPERTQTFGRLYFSEEDEFIEVAEQYLAMLAEEAREHPQRERLAIGTTTTVVHIWLERQFTVDIVPLAMQPLDNQGAAQLPVYVDRLAERLKQQGGTERLRQLFRAAARALIGPEDEQLEIVAEHFDPRRLESHTTNAHVAEYLRLVHRHTSDTGRSFMRGIEESARLQLVAERHNNIRHHIGYAISLRSPDELTSDDLDRLNVDGRDADMRDFAPLFNLLEASHLLADAEQFHTYRYGYEPGEDVLSRLRIELHDTPTGSSSRAIARTALRQWLNETVEPTFGRGLLLALTDDDPNSAVFNYLADHEADLQAVSDYHREALIETIKAWSVDPEQLTEAGRALRETLAGSQWDQELQRVLAAESLDDLGLTRRDVGAFVEDLVTGLMGSAHDDPAVVLRRMAVLVREAEPTLRLGRRYGGWVVGRMADPDRPDLNATALKIWRDDVEHPMAVSVLGDMSMSVQDDLGERDDPLAAMDRIVATLSTDADGKQFVHVVGVVVNSLESWATRHVQATEHISTWADVQEPTTVEQRVRRELGRAATLVMVRRRTMSPAEPRYRRVVRDVAAALHDPSTSLTYRLATAERLVYRLEVPNIDAAAAHLLAQAMADDDIPIHGINASRIIEAMLRDTHERNDAWKTLGDAILEGFVRRQDDMRPGSKTLGLLHDLAHATGNEAATRALRRR